VPTVALNVMIFRKFRNLFRGFIGLISANAEALIAETER
jgi:hypothetical protein